jgi:tRNA (guanine37-N1)-methyltransferase
LRKRLRKSLISVISSDAISEIYNAYDIIGDIAIIKVQNASSKSARTIAKAIMNVHSNVKTVLAQTSAVTGDFRLRSLKHVDGENKTRTIHKEFRCLYSVDVGKCYFSPRLSNERLRITKMIEPLEVIINMFAGVGCFSVLIAKYANPARVYSIDVNPLAVEFMKKNIRLNRVYDLVVPLLGNSKEIINRQLAGLADRVLMPLPAKALEYLPFAVAALKISGGWIHYYDFEYAEKNGIPAESTTMKVAKKLAALDVGFTFPFSRVVRTTGPNWRQVALDIHITSLSDKS